MNRFFTTLTVFGMLLIGVVLSVRQTITAGSLLPMLALQAVTGVGLIAGSVLLVKKRYYRSGRRTRGAGLVAAQPIRRLLSSVWS